MSSQKLNRFKAEVAMLTKNPPPGIQCRVDETRLDIILADISGPVGSPFENGIFTVEVALSERYPFTPPNARFLTPIYHPNVDTTGRICLSGLKPKPAGTWNCSLNIAVILSAIRLLLDEPNLGDPLMADIATEYRDNFAAFRAKAEAKTRQFAVRNAEGFEVMENDALGENIVPSTVSSAQKESAVSNSSHTDTTDIGKQTVKPCNPATSFAECTTQDQVVIDVSDLDTDTEDDFLLSSLNPPKRPKVGKHAF